MDFQNLKENEIVEVEVEKTTFCRPSSEKSSLAQNQKVQTENSAQSGANKPLAAQSMTNGSSISSQKSATKKRNTRIKFHKFSMKTRKFLSKLLFPDELSCTFCGVDIPNFDEQPYCDKCAEILPFNNGHRCKFCDLPIAESEEICDFCKLQPRNFKKAVCPFLYRGEIQQAILSYKNNNQRYRAKAFAKIMFERVKDLKIDVITFIPMTAKRQKERTFNQSELLANELAKLIHAPVLSIFVKTRDTNEQKRLSSLDRQKNVINSYAVKKVNIKKTDNLLIVDDVITTCATVNYCAGLILPKVNDVYVCGIAREYIKPTEGHKANKFSFEEE